MGEAALLVAADDTIRRLDRAKMQEVLRADNPQTPVAEIESVVQVVSFLLDFVTDLPQTELKEIARNQTRFRAALEKATQSVGRAHVEDMGEVEHTRGRGLGEVLTREEGRKRLDRYATPTRLEDWAGDVVGAGQIEKLLGIKRSTLGSWYQQGAVVGLLRGQRKLAYPLDQFVDARPLEGLGELLKLAPDARSTWLWARQPHGALDGRTPLELLRAGQGARVIAVANQDFG